MLTGFAACVDKRIDLHAIRRPRPRTGGQEFFAELMTRAKRAGAAKC